MFQRRENCLYGCSNICNQFKECKVIVVDDGSTDNSYIELKKLSQKFKPHQARK